MSDKLGEGSWTGGWRSGFRQGGLLTGRILKRAGQCYFRHGCFGLAASAAYYSILSFIPFFFVVMYITGRLVVWEGVREAIDRFLQEVVPYYSDVLMSEVTKISIGSGFFGVFGLLFILWTGSLVFDSVAHALNVVFGVAGRRSFIKTKLMSFAIFPAGGFFLVMLLFVAAAVGTLVRIPLSEYLPALAGFQNLLTSWALSLLSYMVLFVVLVLVFRIMPAVRIPYFQACLGAGLCTMGWWIEKWIFGLVILPNPTYGLVYGSLRAMIILIFWIFCSLCVVLFSAEVVAAYRHLVLKENIDG